MNPAQETGSKERVSCEENQGLREKTMLLSKEVRLWIEGFWAVLP